VKNRFNYFILASTLLSACGNIISNSNELVITKTAIATLTITKNKVLTNTLDPTIKYTGTITSTPTDDSSPCSNETYLNANYSNKLSVDNNELLWSASTGGIVRWDIKSNNYIIYTTNNGLSMNTISGIFVANDGSVIFFL
jgi:hypothetical protein